MSEQSFISALSEISTVLDRLALEATEPDDPLSLPEPRDPEEVSAFEAHISTIQQQVDPSLHSLLNTTVRDYIAGYPDRCGAYLCEFLDKFTADASYAQTFSAGSKEQVGALLKDLREL